jgi:hypothetical protein
VLIWIIFYYLAKVTYYFQIKKFLKINIENNFKMGYIKSLKKFSINEDEIRVNPATAGEDMGAILAANKDVKEVGGDNKGPDVEKYLKSVGLEAGQPWCMSFVYYVFEELVKKMGKNNPLPKTGGVMLHWKKGDPALKVLGKDAKTNPALVKPGQIFFLDTGGGHGHAGIVISVDTKDKTFNAIEGNSNEEGSREGKEVSINKRKIDDPRLLGLLDYFKSSRTPEFEADLAKNLNLPTSTISRLGTASGTSATAPAESDSPSSSFSSNLLTGIVQSLRPGSSEITPDQISAALKGLK